MELFGIDFTDDLPTLKANHPKFMMDLSKDRLTLAERVAELQWPDVQDHVHHMLDPNVGDQRTKSAQAWTYLVWNHLFNPLEEVIPVDEDILYGEVFESPATSFMFMTLFSPQVNKHMYEKLMSTDYGTKYGVFCLHHTLEEQLSG